MWRLKTKYRRSSGHVLVLALLFVNCTLFSQKQSKVDSVLLSRPAKIIYFPGSNSFLINGAPFILHRDTATYSHFNR